MTTAIPVVASGRLHRQHSDPHHLFQNHFLPHLTNLHDGPVCTWLVVGQYAWFNRVIFLVFHRIKGHILRKRVLQSILKTDATSSVHKAIVTRRPHDLTFERRNAVFDISAQKKRTQYNFQRQMRQMIHLMSLWTFVMFFP